MTPKKCSKCDRPLMGGWIFFSGIDEENPYTCTTCFKEGFDAYPANIRFLNLLVDVLGRMALLFGKRIMTELKLTLDEYMVTEDSNAYWRMSEGTCQNLLDEAIERMEEVRTILALALCDATDDDREKIQSALSKLTPKSKSKRRDTK